METLIHIIGGAALLLWGIRMVRTGITRSFGAELRRVLAVSAKGRLRAALAGLGVTALLQSGTATCLITASFAGQGLIAAAPALAMALGADLGSTLIVQALSLDLALLSPVLIAAGVFGFMSSPGGGKRRAVARALIGLGLMLLSLRLIGQASAGLRESELLAALAGPLAEEPLLAVIAAALLTWASHSSIAIVLLVMSLAAGGVVGTPLALALVLGANLGAGLIAAGLTARSAPAVRRAPLGNLLMRGAGAAAGLFALPFVLPHLDLLGGSPERAVANFHTGFNLILLCVFLPLLGPVAWIAERLTPERPSEEDPGAPRYLDKGALDTPSVALTAATREALRMGDEVKEMLTGAQRVLTGGDDKMRRAVEDADDTVDKLHEAIKLYLTQLTREEMDADESRRSVEILSFTTNLEHIGDIIEKNLMELAAKKIKGRIAFSDDGRKELDNFHRHIVQNLDLALHVFVSDDVESARKLLEQKTYIRNLEREYSETHFRRMGERRPDTLDSSALHLDILRDLRRINSHLTSAAYPPLERAGELSASRLTAAAAEAE